MQFIGFTGSYGNNPRIKDFGVESNPGDPKINSQFI
jgi:hypothetical protein